MSAIVEYSFYTDTYKGMEPTVTADTFPALYAHASRVIAAMTRFRVTEDNFSAQPSFVQTCYRLALCAQVDSLAINGVETLAAGEAVGFSVGKVRVDGGRNASAGGTLSASVSPAAMLYLEQSGLMNPAVPVFGGAIC